jgi:hypothetical protein
MEIILKPENLLKLASRNSEGVFSRCFKTHISHLFPPIGKADFGKQLPDPVEADLVSNIGYTIIR